MKVHKLLFLSSTVAAIAVNNGCAKNETDRVGANGSDKMKIKHLFSFPIFKFKLKLPFQNTDPGSLPPGQVGSVEEAEKSSSIDKEWKFQPDVTEDATQPSEYKEDANDNDGCDGSDKEEPSLPLALPFKGFGDMFMEMMNVGKDLTLEKIEVLKDILFLIDRIKEQSREENTPENEKVDSDTPEHANVDENSTNSAENGNLSPSIATQGSSDAKIDVWRFSTDRGMIGQLLKRRDISPEDLNNMIKLGDLKRFLKKNKSKGNKADENEHDTVVDKQYDDLEGSLVKREDEEKEVEAEDEDAKFDLTDLSKLKEKLSMSGKANDEGDTTSKLKNIFKKGGDKKKQTDQQEKEGGSSKIKSHFKKDPTLVISTLVTTITTVVNSETQTPDEDCPEDKNQSKPKLYPYLHPKGEEYPEGLYDGDLVSEKEECEDDEPINVPLNLREKTTLKVLGVKEKEKAGEKTQIDKLSFVKRDGKEQVESEFTDKESTPTAGEFEDSDDSDYDDDGNDDKLEKKKSRWSWSSIFGFGKNRKEEEPSPDEPKFESTWLFKNKLRLKKGKSKPVPTITTTTVLNTSRPTDDGTENEEEDGHENIYNDAKTEYSKILKDEEGVYKKNSKNEALQHHKEKYREKNKSGEFKEERIESDRHEQKKEKLEQDFQLGNSKGNLDKRHEIVRSEESIHKQVTEKHQFDLLEQFEDGTNKSNKERHKEDESSFIKNHHELNHHEEDHQNVDYVKDPHELDQTVKEKEHHKDYFRDLNHKKRHAIDHYEDDNHKEITEHHKSDFKEHLNDGSNKHTMQVHNEGNFQVVKDEHELNHHEQNHGDAESSKDVHNLDQFITEKEHHKKYEKNTNHEASLRLTRRDELNQHDNLIIDKGLKSSNTFANDRAKDHYESSRTLGGQRHSKEHYAKEHHEKERHETAPGVEQYEKENHDKEEHAKENHELGPQEHEQVFKEHGKVGNKLASSNDASVEKESRLNMKLNGPLQITPPVSVQVVLPVIG